MSIDDLAIPCLPSRSLAATLAFYAALGFEGEIINGNYAIIERGSVELHFFAYPDLVPSTSSFGCYIRVADVDSIYQAFQLVCLPQAGIPRMDRLEDKPWGMREFAVVDADGSLIRIGEVL